MNFPDNQSLIVTIPVRHSVRRYLETPIPDNIRECLEDEIADINARCGFSFRAVYDEPTSFKNIFAYGKFSNAVNYIIVSAPSGHNETLLCGYEGERLVLGLQALGLNSCWVGLSYSKKTSDFDVPSGHKIRCVICFGYGVTQGIERKSKSLAQLGGVIAASPRWYADAIKAVSLAPTAINQQKFRFTLRADGTVEAVPTFSLVGYTTIDLGIAIRHFNLLAPPPAQICLR